MKFVLLISLFVFSNYSFAQTEQASLDFFSSELLPKLKKTKVYYDGSVISKTGYEVKKIDDEETILENTVWDYSMCKKDSRGLSNTNFDFKKKFSFKEIMKIANVKNSKAENLTVPKNLIFKKSLITRERKAGKLRYRFNKLFKVKYNLKISPSIQIAENTYLTRIFINKRDFEHGFYFDIVVENSKVIDWCQYSWIQ